MTRRVRQLRTVSAWTDEHAEVLLSGFDYALAFTLGQPIEVPTRSREGWDENPQIERRLREAVADMGDELLDQWIAEHPGTRPWFWWRFIAPEPRRCLSGPHRYHSPEYADVPHRYHFGVPAIAVGPKFGIGETFETEREYLTRLNLLTAEE